MKVKLIDYVDRFARSVAFYAAVLGCILIGGIIVVVISSVIGRFIPQVTMYGIVEYSEVFLVGGIFLGLGYAQISGNHVGVDLIVSRLKGRSEVVVRRIGLSAGVLVLLWMIGANVLKAMQSIKIEEYRFGVAMVPIWPARIIVVAGLTIWVVLLVCQIMTPSARPHDEQIKK